MSHPLELYNFLPEKSKSLRENILTFCNAIKVVQIKNRTQYQGAVATAKELAKFEKEATAQMKSVKKPYQNRVALVNEYFKEILSSIDSMKRMITGALRNYDAEQERLRREEQRKRDEEARIERERLEEEARQKREAAEKARQQGETLQAEALETQAAEQEVESAQVVASVVVSQAPQKTGINKVIRWRMEITDPIAFVRHMIKENMHELLQPNVKACNDYARIVKRPVEYPGARICSTESSSIRT
jgi:chemotaxis protein histidine kinase CheA